MPIDRSDDATAQEILRYWLAMIRHEEALSVTIRAAPPVRHARPPRVDEPERGQSYFKLPRDPDTWDLLLGRRQELSLDLSGDRVPFFEHWLNQRYRRERTVHFSKVTADTENDAHVAGFPVLYNPRRGQLMTLLRLRLDGPDWVDATGNAWEAPTWRERTQGKLPPPPMAVKFGLGEADAAPEGSDDHDTHALPFAIGEDVLSRVLGVQEEQIGAFMGALRRADLTEVDQVLGWVLRLLETAPGAEFVPPETLPEGTAEELINQLTEAVRARIVLAQVQVWPMGLVYDGGAVFATHHLQRDIEELLAAGAKLPSHTPLGAYLQGAAPAPRRGVLVGCYGQAAPTEHQRHAAELFLGSPLTAVQGPPGTGKTQLILDLAAHTLVERMFAVAGGELAPSGPLLLVTSTNNRAVDNVVEPLCDDMPPERLPLALRAGSRMVMETVTLPTLERVERWLTTAARPTGVEAARKRLTDAMWAIEAVAGPIRERRREAARHAAIEEDLRRAQARVEALGRAVEPSQVEDIGARRKAIERAARLLSTYVDQATRAVKKLTRDGSPRPTRAARTWQKLMSGWPEDLDAALAQVGLAVERDLAPAEADQNDPEAWDESFTELIDGLAVAENALLDQDDELARLHGPALALDRAREELQDLISRRDALPPLPQVNDAALYELVARHEQTLAADAALVREGWALTHRDKLLRSLKAVIRELRNRLSLRGLEDRDADAWRDLCALFPVMGCTLLSMGNVFAATEGSVERVVIDEAGQCHPAHAISALYRAQQALVIGDPNQLEPVIELNAGEEQRVIRRARGRLDLARLSPYRTIAERANSAQTLAARAVGSVVHLRDHFRCQREIIAISNALCGYDLVVHTPRASLNDRCPLLTAPVVGIRTAGEQQAFIGSWRNRVEEQVVATLAARLTREGVRADDIAVLTPYRGQLRALRDALRAAGLPLDDPEQDPISLQQSLFATQRTGGIAVGTVHRFQGGERDVVIYSAVISRPQSLAFTNQRVNLVNVAVSRARKHLVVVGNPDLLSRGQVTSQMVNAIPTWLDPASLSSFAA